MEKKEWVKKLILAGFKLLKGVRLGNAPKWSDRDALDEEVNAWTLALIASGECRSEQEDFRRFLDAFAKYLPKARYWPRPVEIIELLPPRRLIDTRPECVKALPHLTPGQMEENRRQWKELGKKLCAGMGVPSPRPDEEARRRELQEQAQRLRG